MSETLYCNNCQSVARLEITDNGHFVLKCACDIFPIDISGRLPKDWVEQ